MDQIYLYCAAIGGTLIVCQFLVSLVGIGGGDGDAGDAGGHDGGGHDAAHEVGHDAEPARYFSVLSFRTLTAAAAFFGLAGLAGAQAGLSPAPRLGLAIGAGAAALFVVAWVMRAITRLNLDGTVRIQSALGARGAVYLSIPAAKTGVGKVLVSVHHRTIEYKAVTAGQPLPTGAKVTVIGIVAPDTVEVAPAQHSEGDSHG
jgi:hypothetical protein